MKILKKSLLAVSAVAIALSLSACKEDESKKAESNTATTPAPAEASVFAKKVDFEKIKGTWYRKMAGGNVEECVVKATKNPDVVRITISRNFEDYNLNLTPNVKFDKSELVMASASPNMFMVYDEKNDVLIASYSNNIRFTFTRNKG